MTDQVFSMVVSDWAATDGEKALFGRSREAALRVTEVSAERLAAQVEHLCGYVGSVFQKASAAASDLELESLDVQIEVTATGEVRLIGAVSAEAKGGLTLHFTRKREQQR